MVLMNPRGLSSGVRSVREVGDRTVRSHLWCSHTLRDLIFEACLALVEPVLGIISVLMGYSHYPIQMESIFPSSFLFFLFFFFLIKGI